PRRPAALRRPAPVGDRPRHVHGAGAALPRRAGRRPQSARGRGTRELSARDPRQPRHLDSADRAQYVRGDGDLRPRHRARSRPEDRGRRTGGDSARPEGDRRVPRRRARRGRARGTRAAALMQVFIQALRRCALAALLASAAATQCARAQGYPARPVTLVVPFAPGGGTEVLARLLAQRLEQRLGKPIVIENKPGGGGGIGAVAVARAAPDGYTILMAPSPVVAINVTLHKNLPYDPLTDFVPLALLVASPYVLVVTPSLPAQTVNELIALAKARPGRLAYASAGPGTPHHLFPELLKRMTGIELTHVPYR